MKKKVDLMRLYFVLLIVAGMLLLGSPVLAQDASHKPITLKLMELVEKHPEIGNMLTASIAAAKNINPDPKTNPVQSLSEYYDFIDRT